MSSAQDTDYANEIDLSVGWTGNLGKTGLNVDVGLSHFNIYQLGQWDKSDIMELYIELSLAEPIEIVRDAFSINPYLRTETMRDCGSGESINFETTIHFGLKSDWKITDEISVNQKIRMVYDPGIFDLAAGFVLMYDASVDVKIFKELTWNAVQVRQSVPFVSDRRDTSTVLGTGFTLNF